MYSEHDLSLWYTITHIVLTIGESAGLGAQAICVVGIVGLNLDPFTIVGYLPSFIISRHPSSHVIHSQY
jgi:hypothetical protein